MVIDYRSDTVTKPSPEMHKVMMEAPVGDDVFGEDPSVNELEQLSAQMFGMEAALYCPSGTMTNQIAIKCHTQPGDEVVCDVTSHVYQYEGGGIAFNSGASVKLIQGNLGKITAAQVSESVNADDAHKAHTSLVCLENTVNRGGGSCYDFEEIKRIKKVCDEHNLRLHLDGARLFNALVAKREKATDYGKLFHSISICLSKGLGCPVGSVLIGEKDFIKKARRVRKVLGGGMRQAGYLAAAGIYALKNNIERMQQDHLHAQQIATALKEKDFVGEVLPVETNIIIFSVKGRYTPQSLVAKLKEHSVLGYAISPTAVRLVTHLDITDEMVEKTIATFTCL
ncbi:MAG: aminotransferase class I/II-fold pyridoxal phosphate-dependent enzyme [Flavisolibacter sp.]|nr:aminotransferase class I/II-fold pyridoxal phosphate-dependent enzyme [Flavisolibacter sp.]